MRTRQSITALIFLTLATPALAQPASRPAPAPTLDRVGLILERFQQAAHDLNLSAEQKTRIDRVFADARKKFASIGEQSDARQRLQQVGPGLQQVREDVLAVLDNDQQAQLERTLEQFRKRARDRERQFAPAESDGSKPPTTAPDGSRVKQFF